jgi:hypothetical protein
MITPAWFLNSLDPLALASTHGGHYALVFLELWIAPTGRIANADIDSSLQKGTMQRE